MDESSVRAEAQKHAEATVAGDFKTAGSCLTPEAMAQAGGVMKMLPRSLTSGAVTDVEAEGDAFIVTIAYGGTGADGSDASGTVRSRWEDRDGAPKLVDMEVV